MSNDYLKMNKEIFNYLQNNYTTDTLLVDRLIVSSFLIFNKIEVYNNEFIKKYIILENDIKENKALDEFIKIIKVQVKKFDLETLIELFEFVISPDDKIITGAIYTPKKIREYIVKQTLLNKEIDENFKIADISCGCGSFLYEAALFINKSTNRSFFEIIRDNIFGLDIQNYSTDRTKIVLTLLAIFNGEDNVLFKYNIYTGDALEFKWTNNINDFNGFKCIVGNPPYVCSRNIPANTKVHLSKWEVCSTGHPDLYIPFFQIGIENLSIDGILGYITMNTFFKSVNGRALREYFQKKKLIFKILDFGTKQIFKSKSTYTCICLIENNQSEFLNYIKTNSLKVNYKYSSLIYDELEFKNGWNLEETNLINKIEKTGKPFGELFKTRNGIATLKNNIYIFNPVNEDKEFYYLKFNGEVFPIEKGICKNIINPNKFTKIDNVKEINRKLIFPYLHVNCKVQLIDEDIFKKKFPFSYNYLKSKEDLLAQRDKGEGNYEKWYAYGRNQSLEKLKFKLFFPHITPDIPNYVINTDENLLFHNGLAVVTENENDLFFLQKLMSSKIFWFYIKNTSKPYGSDYYSLSRNYIKNFGVYDFSDEEKTYIINEQNKSKLDSFFEERYGIQF